MSLFFQEREVLKADFTVLYRNYATKSNYEITRIKLKEFNDKQIKEYILKNTRDKEEADEYMEIIKNTYNLEELSTRPLLLDMIIKTLPGLKDKKKINASHLYKAYTDIWIDREDWRSQMTDEGKRCFMWKLALKMFNEGGDFSVHYSKLDKPKKTHLKENFEILDDDYYRYETTTCSFLNRDQEGNYKFIHKSFMEYFLAEYFFHRIKNNEKRIISPDQLNKETEFFLKLMISSERSDLKNLDLSYLDLENIDLEAANFYGSTLRQSKLNRTDLRKANLTKANFYEASLKEASLIGANFQEANFQKANLQGAKLDVTKLRGANLHGAILQSFDLKNVDLNGFDLQKVNLCRANLQQTNLHEAYLQGANLQDANLQDANLQGADLEKCNLSGTNLLRVNLKDAKLQRANLQGADLRGANLRVANLQEVNLQGANLDNANLEEVDLLNAKNIPFEMLLKVRSLYRVKSLKTKIERRLKGLKPELFEYPSE